MILPITIIGMPVLRKKTEEITEDYPKLDELITSMFDTMYNADGIGLAAPQVNVPVRLFIIDATPMVEDEPSLEDFKRVFINPHIIESEGEVVSLNEGCLSVPGIREDVKRIEKLTIEYYNENWELKTEKLDGWKARIIQHEYDHLDGVLFTDRIPPLRKRMLKAKLVALSKGIFDADYKTKVVKAKR